MKNNSDNKNINTNKKDKKMKNGRQQNRKIKYKEIRKSNKTQNNQKQ